MAHQIPARGEILRCLRQAERPLPLRAIAAESGVPEGRLSALEKVLEELCAENKLQRLPGRRYAIKAQGGLESWEGFLTVNPRGFGFVNAPGRSDVYVAPDAIGAALHGDRVVIEVIAHSSRGIEGRITRVVERRSQRVAGLLRRRGKSVWLEPDDTRLRGPIVLHGASRSGKDGEAAVVQITRFPEYANENPEGELLGVLGQPGDPKVEVAKILLREQVETTHSEAALREAELFAARTLSVGSVARRDLRQLPLPTIDPEDARDHDDAVWVVRTKEGYRAWIAIADVSEYVHEGSELDREALKRGCTLYLPDRAVPMLPTALAADLCSLLPEQDRLCLCVIADLDSKARVKKFEIVEGLMRSGARLTYEGVAHTLGFTETGPNSPAAEALRKELEVMAELTGKLRRTRLSRGALDLDLPEAKVVLDPESGVPLDVVRRAANPGVRRAYGLVEELMLLANELVAQWLGHQNSPAVYRVHGKPNAEKLSRLGALAQKLGVSCDLEALLEPLGVARFLEQVRRHPRRVVLESLLLRSLEQASYSVDNIGHFGLASESYLHFTSPIRRYPDLVVHRQVKRLLRGKRPDHSPEALEALHESAAHASLRERAALDIEREVVDLYRVLLMRDRVGQTYSGTVTAFVGSGAYMTLDEPFVDVLVRYESMGPDHYALSEDDLSVVGSRSGERLELGDRWVVTIEDVAVLRRTVYGRRSVPTKTASAAEGRTEGRKQAAPGPRSEARELSPARRKRAQARSNPEKTPARAPRKGRTTTRGPKRGR